jgi:hypothetical protein
VFLFAFYLLVGRKSFLIAFNLREAELSIDSITLALYRGAFNLGIGL